MVRAPVDALRRPRVPRDLVTDVGLIVAALGSVVLAVVAATYHAAGSAIIGVGANGSHVVTTPPARTLVETDGAQVELVVLLPLVAVIITAVVLGRRRRLGRTGAGPAAWAVTGVVGAVCVVGILTVGPLLLPVAAGLVLAVAGAQARSVDRA